MKVRPATVALVIFAGAAVVFATWRDFVEASALVSGTQVAQASRRVFADLGTLDLAKATLELAGPEGRAVRMVPSVEGGHLVMVGDDVLGPADTEYLAGAWASLRIASALRSVPKGTETEAGRHGAIRIGFPDRTLTLQLGRKTPDGVGVYAVLKSGETGTWVVEEELARLVEEPAQSWIARRLSDWDVERIGRVAFADANSLARGEDGLWRKLAATSLKPGQDEGLQQGELLSTPAVNLRLARILSAGVEAFVDRQAADPTLLRPWLTLTDLAGASQHLMVGGACPGHAHSVLVDRGAGRLVCIEADLSSPWPLSDPSAGFLESQLIPHAYAAVAEVHQQVPTVAHLRRRPGAWELATGAADARYSVVVEAEVFRWFERLRSLSLTTHALDEAGRAGFSPQFSAVLTLDSRQTVSVVCGWSGNTPACQRDAGPFYPVSGAIDERMVLDFELLADRTVLSLAADLVRAVEIDGPSEGPTLRQSVRSEYGQWQLEAPAHPDSNAALDQVRLETLVAALGSLRAERWVQRPGPLERTLRVVHAPLADKRGETLVRLFAQCVVQVQQGRYAQLDPDSCTVLKRDLLFDDPFAFALRDLRGLEVSGPIVGGATLFLERPADGWRVVRGEAAAESVIAAMQAWEAWRATRLVRGRPPGVLLATLVVHRRQNPSLALEVGRDWIRLTGADWYYAVESAPAEPGP